MDLSLKIEVQVIMAEAANSLKQLANNIKSDFSNAWKIGHDAIEAFNKHITKTPSVVGEVTTTIRNLVATFISFEAVRKVNNILQDADTAFYSLRVSVEAANKQFRNVGDIDYWNDAIKRLSQQLKIYSDSALAEAISRTIDMTKRLGLSKEQMEEVIKRSADLGAGKVDLSGAIERVTAALRGEAEASEYLGLTLNENYIKAWYEAKGATLGAWASLSDLEKAQIRYMAFLEQSEGMLGRAAGYVNTFGGALQLVRKEIENAIISNQDLSSAMQSLAENIRLHAADIGELASRLVQALAWIIQKVIEFKDELMAIGAVIAGFKVISTIIDYAKATYAALEVVISGLKNLQLAFLSAKSAIGAGLIIAISFTGYELTKLISEINQLRNQMKEFHAEARQWEETAKQYEHAKDIQIKSIEQILAMSEKERQAYKENLKEAINYYSALATSAELMANDAMLGGLLPFQSAKGKENEAKAKEYRRIVNELVEELKMVGRHTEVVGQSIMSVPQQTAFAVKATSVEIDKVTDVLKKSYQQLQKEIEEYGKKIINVEEQLFRARKDTADLLLNLNRKLMTEEESWNSKRLEAEQKLALARQLFTQGQYELAIEAAKESQKIYASLNNFMQITTETGKQMVASLAKEAGISIEELQNKNDALLSGIKSVAYDLQRFFNWLPADMRDSLKAMGIDIESIVNQTIRFVERSTQDLSAATTSGSKDQLERVKSTSETVIKNLDEVIEKVKAALVSSFKSASDTQRSTLDVMDQRLARLLENTTEVSKSYTETGTQAATEIARRGVQEAGQAIEDILQAQKKAFSETQNTLQEKAASIQQILEDITKPDFKWISIDLNNLPEVQDQLKELTKTETKKIQVQIQQIGGGKVMITEEEEKWPGFHAGGRLPGYGGGDTILALLEPGEYVVRKEAAQRYSRLLDIVNRMELPVDLPRFRKGGWVESDDENKIILRRSIHEGPLLLPIDTQGRTYYMVFDPLDIRHEQVPIELDKEMENEARKVYQRWDALRKKAERGDERRKISFPDPMPSFESFLKREFIPWWNAQQKRYIESKQKEIKTNERVSSYYQSLSAPTLFLNDKITQALQPMSIVNRDITNLSKLLSDTFVNKPTPSMPSNVVKLELKLQDNKSYDLFGSSNTIQQLIKELQRLKLVS